MRYLMSLRRVYSMRIEFHASSIIENRCYLMRGKGKGLALNWRRSCGCVSVDIIMSQLYEVGCNESAFRAFHATIFEKLVPRRESCLRRHTICCCCMPPNDSSCQAAIVNTTAHLHIFQTFPTLNVFVFRFWWKNFSAIPSLGDFSSKVSKIFAEYNFRKLLEFL